jgi:hypothetical protein
VAAGARLSIKADLSDKPEAWKRRTGIIPVRFFHFYGKNHSRLGTSIGAQLRRPCATQS